MKDDSTRSIVVAMLVSAAIVIPLGMLLALLVGGDGVVAGAAAGFGVAMAHTIAFISVLKWVLRKPPDKLTYMMMASSGIRLVILAAVLFGLSLIKALNMVALLAAFLSLYLVHTSLEFVYAWKSFAKATGRAGK